MAGADRRAGSSGVESGIQALTLLCHWVVIDWVAQKRQAVQKMIDDWAEGGVMAYDAPVDTTDMRYHSMIPVEELVPYSPRMYRSDKREFDARYKMFIKTGPTYPVYLSIGQNGRAKVTGGEDLIFFAKKSGLKELPVFFSFQKQV